MRKALVFFAVIGCAIVTMAGRIRTFDGRLHVNAGQNITDSLWKSMQGSERTFLNKVIESPGVIVYTLGTPKIGDLVWSRGVDEWQFAGPVDVLVFLPPQDDMVPGGPFLVSHVRVVVEQTTDEGQAFVAVGGVGQGFISIGIEADNVKFIRTHWLIVGH